MHTSSNDSKAPLLVEDKKRELNLKMVFRGEQ